MPRRLEKPATAAAAAAAGAGRVEQPVLRPRAGAPVGVLWAPAEASRFRHARYLPSADLAAHVEHIWVVRWDLRGAAPFRQETLPHPSVHLVVEAGHSGLAGVPRGRFTKGLAGRGRAVVVKFRPGGFRALWPAPVHTLTGRVLPLGDAFGRAGDALEQAVLACRDGPWDDQTLDGDATGADRWPDATDVDARVVAHVEAFLRTLVPSRVPSSRDAGGFRWDQAALVAGLVERITRDRALATVEDVARAAGVSARTVQRLFRDYVGVSAKWVLCRQRLHDAATRLGGGPPAARGDTWARLALDLGFYDQAHFVRSFTALVGLPPAAYVRRLGAVSAGDPT